jgi:hypothetical protein
MGFNLVFKGLITHNSTFKMANARKTTIGASAYNAHGDNNKTSITTLTVLLKYQMSYCFEMPEISGCNFSISYL